MSLLTYFVASGCGGSTVNTTGNGGTQTGGETSTSDGVVTTNTPGSDTTTGTITGTITDTTSGGMEESTGGETTNPVCPGLDDDDPDAISICRQDCGANSFDLEHLSAINYASMRVDLLSPQCIGSGCPAPLATGTYGDEVIVPCVESPEALASVRGPEAYCRFAPLALLFGIDIGFTEPPEAESITVRRARINVSVQVGC